MHRSRLVRALPGAVALVAAAAALAASCSDPDPCASNPCNDGETCSVERSVAVCRPAAAEPDAGTPDAGTHPGPCVPACHANQTCDFDLATCVTCTAKAGCDDPAAPVCDRSVPGGKCVGCAADGDCPGSTCDTEEHHCRAIPDAGTPDAGTPDAGVPDCNATLDCDPPCEADETCIAGRCKPHVGCSTECERGFHCVGGTCVLNGGGGPIQVTLRWSDPEDLDLHVVEPGGCEIYYGNTTCVGSLDLDSNAGCDIDDVDIENVIYPATGTPPSGTYRVRVDYFQNCSAHQPVPYELIVRTDGSESGFCGVFQPGQSDEGAAGSGRTVTTFTYP